MRICLIANAKAVPTQRWAEAYAARGHDVHVLSIRDARIDGVTVHKIALGPIERDGWLWILLSYARLFLTARFLLARMAPDVVHAHHTISHGVIAAFSGFHPFVLSPSGSDVIWSGDGPMPSFLRWLNRYAIGAADLVTSTSKFMRKHIDEFASPESEIALVPFGVDPEVFQPARGGDATGEFQIGFVKTFRARYGPETLINALPAVLAEVPEARLIMAGRGPLAARLRDLADRLGVGPQVQFPGFVPSDAVPTLMQRLDVFVNCSEAEESFGVAVLEASACGLPVVATDTGGVPEVCRDGDTAIMVPPGDSAALAQAIIRLAQDKKLRTEMGRAGRRFVEENFSWDDNVEQMLALIDGLVAAGRAGPGQANTAMATGPAE